MHTFLAANTANGFYSLFDELCRQTDHNILLIKGGPGTGKSTLMRTIADAAEQKGYRVERIHCSSDHNSLDGVVVTEKRLILLDATPPHCVDPKYPGAVEQILPLGEYWDRSKLIPHRRRIIRLTEEIHHLFTRIYRLLHGVGTLQQYSDGLLEPTFDTLRGEKAVQKILSRQAATDQHRTATVTKRFLSAITAEGHVLFEDAFANCRNVLMIEDSFDDGHRLTALFDARLLALGYDRTVFCDPLLPQRIDHIYVPALDLGILRQNSRLQWKQPLSVERTIHMRQLSDHEQLSEIKNKLQFAKKLCRSIYDEVAELMASEKALHDELEQCYIEAMDFDALQEKADELRSTLL